MYTESAHGTLTMFIYSARADAPEFAGYLFAGKAVGEKADHLPLAWTQVPERIRPNRSGCSCWARLIIANGERNQFRSTAATEFEAKVGTMLTHGVFGYTQISGNTPA